MVSRASETEPARRALIGKFHARRLNRLRQRAWLERHRAEHAARKRLYRKRLKENGDG